jgi:molybdate transport system substrate-binding protein
VKKILFLLMVLAMPAAYAGTLLVAAASDLVYCIDELGAAFSEEVPGAEVRVSTGASGNFFAQIKRGAPFDVFMSADMDYPRRLAREGAADPASLATYAIGRLAVWTLDARFDVGQGMRVFADRRLARVAIANPEVAPYGRAARAALVRHGVWDALQGKLVIGENIAQAAQFVQTGNAQLGIVSLATVLSPRLKGVGRYYLVPEGGIAPIEQGAIVTRHGQGNPLAARFVRFLQTGRAQAILVRSGFGLPRMGAGGGA